MHEGMIHIEKTDIKVRTYQTDRTGRKLSAIKADSCGQITHDGPIAEVEVFVDRTHKRQTITGFGGSFTDASAYLVNQMSLAQRQNIIKAYFSCDGANYTLTRTHMNSCDFSRRQYAYAPVAGDVTLTHFNIDHDRDYLIPMIKMAQKVSQDGFRLIASPWTAPPWMKDNNSWVGGELLKEHYTTWAKFFAKYVEAYELEGIPIWGFTVENEPHGNGENWESMHFTPEQMTDFVRHHLGPTLEHRGLPHVKLLGYDQNREGLDHWVSVMYRDVQSARYFDGTAVHWYESTWDYFPEALERAHAAAPEKYLIQTEACCDAQKPVWQDDDWYWREEATDWGYTWREPEKKYLHPKYAPVHRYARDIIGCLNHWVDGWIDWNMVLDREGGPNWFENWCIAPVIVDPDRDQVYYTPIYYVMSHFSKFIRPGHVVLGHSCDHKELMFTVTEGSDGEVVMVVFNPTSMPLKLNINGFGSSFDQIIDAQAIQTITINN